FTLGNTAISVLYTLSLHAALPISVVRLRRNETARAEELGELQAVDRVHKRQSVVVHRALLLDELARGEPRRNRVGTTRRTGVEHRATTSTVDRAPLRLEQHLAATTGTRSDLHLRGTDLGGRDTRAADLHIRRLPGAATDRAAHLGRGGIGLDCDRPVLVLRNPLVEGLGRGLGVALGLHRDVARHLLDDLGEVLER